MEQHHDDRLSASRLVAAVSLFGVGLLVLVVSGTVGTGAPDLHDRPTAVVAGVLWLISLVVAARDDVARRVLGLGFVVLVVAISAGTFVPRFHFVWPARSTELLLALALLAAVALGLLGPSLFAGRTEYSQRGSSAAAAGEGRPERRMSVEARTLLWLATGVVSSTVGFNVGQELGNPVLWSLCAAAVVTLCWAAVMWRRSRRR